jgi:hypothetical protein
MNSTWEFLYLIISLLFSDATHCRLVVRTFRENLSVPSSRVEQSKENLQESQV